MDERFKRRRSLEKKNEFLTIEKEWQAIHFLLTGEITWDKTRHRSPLRNVIFGGANLPYLGSFGPYRYLTPAQVTKTAKALSKISPETLKEKGVQQEIDKLYANDSPHKWSDHYWEYMLAHYKNIVRFFNEASETGQYIIMSIG